MNSFEKSTSYARPKRQKAQSPLPAALEIVLESTDRENFKVIAKANPYEIEILALRTWVSKEPRTMPVYFSFHGTSSISEVSVGQSSMIGNSLIDLDESYTTQIGELQINGDGRTFQLELNDYAKQVIEVERKKGGESFAKTEVLFRLNDIRADIKATLDRLDKSSKSFGGARFYGINDEQLQQAIAAEGLENSSLYKPYNDTNILNVDAWGQLGHKERYNRSINEFESIAAIQSLQQISAIEFDPLKRTWRDAVQRYLDCQKVSQTRLDEFKSYVVTSSAIDDVSEITSGNLSKRHEGTFYLSILNEDRKIIATATVWNSPDSNSNSKVNQAYNEALLDGADAKGGIVVYEVTSINADAPKGTSSKLQDLVNIVFGQTNCETLVEIPRESEKTNLKFSLEIEQSQLAAKRILRMAAGQVFLAKARAEEIKTNEDLSESEKNYLCEEVGRDLHCWFQLALNSLNPSGLIFNSVPAQQTPLEKQLTEWHQWVEESPLFSVLDHSRRYSFNSQFFGAEWFNENWDNFYQKGAKRIIDSIAVSNNASEAYVADYQLSTLTPSVRQALTKILQGWRIDDSKQTRQMGFEWTVSEEEIEGYLQKDSAVLHILILNDKPAGVMISFTDIGLSDHPDQQMPSSGGSIASKQWCDENKVPYEQAMYCYIVAIDKDFREELKSTEIPAYPMLIEAMEQTAKWIGAKYVLGGVRIDGNNHKANVAMAAHIRNGWNPEPFTFKSRIGSTLTLVSRTIKVEDNKFDRFAFSAFKFPSASNLNLVLGDPAVLAQEDRNNSLAIRDGNSAQSFATQWLKANRLDSYCHARADHGTLSGGQHGVGLWKNNSQYYFYQVAPNKDKWVNRDTRQVTSFEECLAWFGVQARKPPY